MRKIISLSLIYVCVFLCLNFGGCVDNRPIERCFLSVEYENGRIFGKVGYDLYAKENKIIFNLYPNAFGKDHEMQIVAVVVDGKNFEWKTFGKEEQFLSVDLKDKKKGEEVNVSIEFSTVVPFSLSRLGNSGKVINFAYFYPTVCYYDDGYIVQPFVDFGDPFHCEFYDFSVRITVPSIMSVACGGEAEGIGLNGEKTVYAYGLKRAKTFAFSMSEFFNVVSKKCGNKRVNYYYCDEKEPEKRLEKIIDCLSFLSENVGEYPYDSLTVVKSPYYAGGMEYPAFCVVGECGNEEEFERALIHEICHQYMPISFGLNEFESGYLDEGLTEFLTQTYLQKQDKSAADAHAIFCKSYLQAFKRAEQKKNVLFDGVMKKSLTNFQSREQYVATAYYKGYLLFYKINEKTDLMKGLKKLYKDKKFQKICEKDLYNAFEKDKKAVEKIFERFVFNGDDIA